MQKKLVELIGVTVKIGTTPILQDISLTINKGEQWAIVGRSGSGKTTLAKAIAGEQFHSGKINFYFNGMLAWVEQQHHFKNLSNTSDFYYQQRYNASDADKTLTVAEVLTGYKNAENENVFEHWIDKLHLRPLLERPLIQLSNGQNKRLQLAEALLEQPNLLLLDNPFLGLDVEGRQTLHQIVQSIISTGIHIILITSPGELHEEITHVAVLDNGKIIEAVPKKDYHPLMIPSITNLKLLNDEFIKKLQVTEKPAFNSAVKMIAVNIRYGETQVLKNINWEVKRSERWCVSGPNGSGKSTLLSLVTADNPQAYANEIYLFDRKRGSGETIWDIKRNIGYVSPELHLYFESQVNCYEVIASGFFDTIGLFRPVSDEQHEKIILWMQLLNVSALQQKFLSQLSGSQQRMVLLARALVKNPFLLVLDEPCQGLDEDQSAYFRKLVDEICIAFDTTLIYVSHYKKDIPDVVKHYMELDNGSVLS